MTEKIGMSPHETPEHVVRFLESETDDGKPSVFDTQTQRHVHVYRKSQKRLAKLMAEKLNG